jgi:TrmH family RNA methyltransferase
LHDALGHASTGTITSLHNPVLKRARSLLRRKGRIEERAFLVEGVRAVSGLLEAGAAPSLLFVRDEPADLELAAALDVSCPVRVVSAGLWAGISDVPSPQGIIAIVDNDQVTTESRFDVWDTPFVLVADGVRDPGNLGTLLRTAAGAGVTDVLVTPNSVDPFNPKCVRAAMGAHFLVSLRQVSWPDLAAAMVGISVVAVADANGDRTYDDVAWTEPCAVVIGGEAFGPQPEMYGMATAYVRIPLARNLESLNAGVAGSHVVLEAARQRRRAASFPGPES